jgi:dihydrofolate synthase/folylpolyglutamate synthase
MSLPPALKKFPKFGRGPGVERVRALLQPLTDQPWYRDLDALKITGSNGKGSVAAFSAALLQASGLSCGLYTSPHLRRCSERFRVNGEEITAEELAASTAWLEARVRAAGVGESVGAFEAFTALALHHFSQRRPAAVVLEAGIGGRLDPTRVPPGRYVAVTSIDLEHTELLGETEEEILAQKADLAPEGGTLVHGPLRAALLASLQRHAARRELRLVSCQDVVHIHPRRLAADGTVADLVLQDRAGEVQLPEVHIALPGQHQLDNAAVAVALVREWLRAHHPARLGRFPQAIRQALGSVRWPGQLQRAHRDPDIFLDFAHTPGAMHRLTATVEAVFGDRPLLLITGVSRDKKIEAILESLLTHLPRLAHILCTRAHHKGAPVAAIRQHAAALRPDLPIGGEETIEAALESALKQARQDGLTVLVAGGLFLAAEAAEVLRGGDPQHLYFL